VVPVQVKEDASVIEPNSSSESDNGDSVSGVDETPNPTAAGSDLSDKETNKNSKIDGNSSSASDATVPYCDDSDTNSNVSSRDMSRDSSPYSSCPDLRGRHHDSLINRLSDVSQESTPCISPADFLPRRSARLDKTTTPSGESSPVIFDVDFGLRRGRRRGTALSNLSPYITARDTPPLFDENSCSNSSVGGDNNFSGAGISSLGKKSRTSRQSSCESSDESNFCDISKLFSKSKSEDIGASLDHSVDEHSGSKTETEVKSGPVTVKKTSEKASESDTKTGSFKESSEVVSQENHVKLDKNDSSNSKSDKMTIKNSKEHDSVLRDGDNESVNEVIHEEGDGESVNRVKDTGLENGSQTTVDDVKETGDSEIEVDKSDSDKTRNSYESMKSASDGKTSNLENPSEDLTSLQDSSGNIDNESLQQSEDSHQENSNVQENPDVKVKKEDFGEVNDSEDLKIKTEDVISELEKDTSATPTDISVKVEPMDTEDVKYAIIVNPKSESKLDNSKAEISGETDDDEKEVKHLEDKLESSDEEEEDEVVRRHVLCLKLDETLGYLSYCHYDLVVSCSQR